MNGGPVKVGVGALLQEGHNFIVAVAGALIALIFLTAVSLTWGLLVLLGLMFIGSGLIILIFNRGEYMDYIFIFCMSVGLVFILLHMAGYGLWTVDLSVVPGLEAIHNAFH